MTALSGKTHAILGRLPHFFAAQDAGDLLVQFADLFGRRLARAEVDALRVLRAHHVETADNAGSLGYTAQVSQRGDLDKIFALYLETIGGTTQLVKMSPRFVARSLDVREMAELLLPRSGQGATGLAAAIYAGLKPATRELLKQYTPDNVRFRPAEIKPGFVIALLRGQSSTPAPLPAGRRTVATYLRDRLSRSTRALLDVYAGENPLPLALAAAIARDFNLAILRDPALYRKHADEFDQHDLPKAGWALLRGINRDFLLRRYAQEPDPVKRASLLTYLDEAPPARVPAGDDQMRLNRLLLQSAFGRDPQRRPWGIEQRSIPSVEELHASLLEEFNRLLDGEELFRPAWLPELEEDYPALRRRYRDSRAWLNRLVLETAFPTAIEKSYTPYQERMRGLIQVLRQGASTRDGIVALVAANLGIVDDTPAARRQRQRIRIEEFAPVEETQRFTDIRPYSRFVAANPSTQIRVWNPNLADVTPELQLRVQVGGASRDYVPLTHWSIANRSTGQSLVYDGALRHGDQLLSSAAQGLRINGIPLPAPPAPLVLPPGESLLEVEVLTGLIGGRFDRTLYGLATLSGEEDAGATTATRGVFDESHFSGVMFDRGALDHLLPEQAADVTLELEVSLVRLTPGRFKVVVPWDLGDFPADAGDPAGHPRNQIQDIIDKVRAAGVFATVSYEQQFADAHDLGEQTPAVQLARPVQAVPVAAATQEQADQLILSGAFGYTRFDSLNSFA